MQHTSVCFIRFDEPNADDNYRRAKHIFGDIHVVEGVVGISNAYRAAAVAADSAYVLTIDADTYVYSRAADELDRIAPRDAVFVWRSLNVVNNLVYGYGAIKLWPTQRLLDDSILSYTDFTMSVARRCRFGYSKIDIVVSETRFNSSPFSAWRSGFREGCKMYLSTLHEVQIESKYRLESWLTEGAGVRFGDFAMLGAHQAVMFASGLSESAVSRCINDYKFLRTYFEENVDEVRGATELLSSMRQSVERWIRGDADA